MAKPQTELQKISTKLKSTSNFTPGKPPARVATTPSIKGGWQSLVKNPAIRKV